MKILLTFLSLSVLPAGAQDRIQGSAQPQGVQETSIGTATIVKDSGAKILGGINDGKTVEAAPALRLIIPKKNILTSRSVKVGERDVIIQQIRPVALPTPAPVESRPASKAQRSLANSLDGSLKQAISAPQSLALSRTGEEAPSTELVFVNAKIHYVKDRPGQVFTQVEFTSSAGAPPVILWSSANWAYLTGFASFAGADGRNYGLMMSISEWDAETFQDLNEYFGGTAEQPVIPNFAATAPATYSVSKGPEDADTLAAVNALHELYNRDLDALKQAWIGREQAAAEKAAELEANPPEKKNIVLRYWRVDRAGQQGVSPTPATLR